MDGTVEDQMKLIKERALNMGWSLETTVDGTNDNPLTITANSALVSILKVMEPDDVIIVTSAERLASNCRDAEAVWEWIRDRSMSIYFVETGVRTTNPAFLIEATSSILAFQRYYKRIYDSETEIEEARSLMIDEKFLKGIDFLGVTKLARQMTASEYGYRYDTWTESIVIDKYAMFIRQAIEEMAKYYVISWQPDYHKISCELNSNKVKPPGKRVSWTDEIVRKVHLKKPILRKSPK